MLRLFSALLAAITVLFVFLFLRELIPSTPWAWTVGALAVAFQPMFGFTSSGVTSDTVLYAASAGIFFLFALCFRRGLTPRRGLASVGWRRSGSSRSSTCSGWLPGSSSGSCVLVLRADRERRREADPRRPDGTRRGRRAGDRLHGPQLDRLGPRPLVRHLGRSAAERNRPREASRRHSGGILDAASYMWQFYLPRLRLSCTDFFHEYQLRQIWFNGFIGQFGWLDFGFPQWVYNWSLVLALGLLALVARELVARRAVLRSRIWELATYLVLTFGLLVLIAATSYVARQGGATGYEQPRYLFPLLALYGALIALAARGAGKRYGPAAGVFIVCIAIAHTAAAMLLTLTRYYG